MPTRVEVERLARKLHSLAGGANVRRKAAARELASRDPLEATELLHHLLRLSREGSEACRCMLTSFLSALEREPIDVPGGVLRRIANLQDLDSVADLFLETPAQAEMDPDIAAKKVSERWSVEA